MLREISLPNLEAVTTYLNLKQTFFSSLHRDDVNIITKPSIHTITAPTILELQLNF